MPTYTQTGLVLPANGEFDGIWGEKVNDNTEIIDRLTNGIGSIALSGTTHTLTTLQGELSPGQFAVLVFGGSPSGTNTVTINPNDAQHVYIVRNTTAQSVVLTQGSGGNVTVPAGKSAIVASDGAGAGAAVTDITAGFAFQAPSAALTDIAALAVTDGNFIVGNGTTWVAESGNTVLTSIGVTATTAELNVLDGIPATLTSDELGYVDGVTSAIQTQLDAKAPLTSPTFTGDVTVPDKIVHSGDTNTAIRFPVADTVTIETNGSERLRVNSAGNVGIGTTAPDEQLHITGNFRIGSAVMPTPSGSAPLYACRAYARIFTSTTPPNASSSGNVSSVTKLSTGRYKVNFATNLPSDSGSPGYAVILNADFSPPWTASERRTALPEAGGVDADSVTFWLLNSSGSPVDGDAVRLAIFR